MIFNLYKKRGETPLECLKRFVRNQPKLEGKKITYLGRLDPLAEGVLIAASGTNAGQGRREELLKLDKEYEFTAIFGFATDTYDILGKVTRAKKADELSYMDIKKVAMIYEGEREQKYPDYSSKMLARKLKSEAPIKKVTIYKLQFHKLETFSNKELFGRILMDISKVNGNFRQQEILKLWKETLFKNSENKILVAHFSAQVSSGTYIRSLVNDMGATLGCGAAALAIKRTRVGDYKIENSLK